jgi:hypothetical protein
LFNRSSPTVTRKLSVSLCVFRAPLPDGYRVVIPAVGVVAAFVGTARILGPHSKRSVSNCVKLFPSSLRRCAKKGVERVLPDYTSNNGHMFHLHQPGRAGPHQLSKGPADSAPFSTTSRCTRGQFYAQHDGRVALG